MARCSATALAVNANSTTLPNASLYAPAGQGLILREVGVFNNGTNAVRMKLVRLSTTGTQGTGLTETALWPSDHTVLGTAFPAHSGAPTIAFDIAPMPVGASVGAGTILTFYGEGGGIQILAGTGNGVGVVDVAAVSQAVDVYFIWDE
jgi:hypothetical protein